MVLTAVTAPFHLGGCNEPSVRRDWCLFQSWDITSGESKLVVSYNLTQATKMAKLNSVLKSTLANDNIILLHFDKQRYTHSPNHPAQPSTYHSPQMAFIVSTLSSKPSRLFPPHTQRRFYHSGSSLLHSEGFETLPSKNGNKHQTELWKHQRFF